MKKMSKLLCMLLALAMVFALCACGNSSDADVPNEYGTVTPGKLTVAISPDYPPFEFYTLDENSNPVLAGTDPSLAQYIADYLNLELEVILIDFDGVLNELAAGKVDLAVSCLSPDPSRTESMDFSISYITSENGGQSFVTTQDKVDLFPTLEDASNPNYKIGAQNGSIQLDLANLYAADADIIPLAKATDIVADLLSGKMDGAFLEESVAENFAANYAELVVLHAVPYDVDGNAVGVVKGNAALLEGVNAAIAAALEDGSIDKFVAEADELSKGTVYIRDEDGNIVEDAG